MKSFVAFSWRNVGCSCSNRTHCSSFAPSDGTPDIAATSVTAESSEGEGEEGKGKRVCTLSLPTVSAPEKLQTALKKVLDAYPRKKLMVDGHVMYEHLISRKTLSRVQESRRRRGLLTIVPVNLWSEKERQSHRETAKSVLRYGSRETLAYAASRLQATYGSTLRVLNEIAVRDPSFHPETMLDFGSGLGTAVWAANQLWQDSLFEIQTVDTSSEMGDMARRLRAGGDLEEEQGGEGGGGGGGWGGGGGEGRLCEAIPGVYFRQYLPTSNKVQYDIVTAGYTLGDLPTHNIRRLSLASLWRKTKKYLVLVELGNSVGFQNILEARDFVLDAPNWPPSYSDHSAVQDEDTLEGHVFAPCPHSHKCPLFSEKGQSSGGPCHFGQRTALDFSNREVLKHKGHSIESFSYVIVKKGRREEGEAQYSRVLRPIKKRTRHTITQQCLPDGSVKQVIYTKSKHGSVYRQSRHSKWGDLLPHDPGDDVTSTDTHTEDGINTVDL